MATSKGDAALEYARQGWPVFPCRTNKTPYTINGVLEATTNLRKIEEWWEEYPNANIGCDIGGAGMVAVDLDPGHDIDALMDIVGDLETPLIQYTPRGGEHLFFRKHSDEIIPPSSGRILDHVDIRSHHSYVLLAPSTTKDGEYSWHSKGTPPLRSDALFKAAAKHYREQSADHDTWLIEADLPENVADCANYLKNKANIAVDGVNGDDMAYRTAAMCKSFGISQGTAFELMWEHWNPRCSPPWDAAESEQLELKIENGYKYNTSPPGNVTKAYQAAKQAALFKPVSRETTTGGTESEVGRFRIIDERGVESIRPPSWLIQDAITQNSYAMLLGPRSTYKTFIALDMALSIATGGANWFEDSSQWLGCWPNIPTQGPVAFAAGEGRAGFKARVNAWRSYHLDGDYTENFYLVDPVPHPTVDDTTAFIELLLATRESFELVVLDTVGRSMQGLNENSQQDASQFTLMVQTIQKELNTSVLAIHHTGHQAADRARGSSVFGADVDSEFVTERHHERIVAVYNNKQKDAPEWDRPNYIRLLPHKDSLVAVKPTSTPQELVPAVKGTKKSKIEVKHTVDLIRTVAYQIMKNYPAKEWNKSQLSKAIAHDERIELSPARIRNAYIEELITDSSHPVANCYLPDKSCWKYTP